MPLINEFSTVPTLLRNVVKNIHKPEETFLIHKQGSEWAEISFEDTLKRADAVSAFFLEKGIKKRRPVRFNDRKFSRICLL